MKRILIAFAALTLLLISACKKSNVTGRPYGDIFDFFDCLGKYQGTVADVTESDAKSMAASYSTPGCTWTYVKK